MVAHNQGENVNRTLIECIIAVACGIIALGVIAFVVCFFGGAGTECWHRCSKAWDRWLAQRESDKQARSVVDEAEQYVRTAQQPREGEQ